MCKFLPLLVFILFSAFFFNAEARQTTPVTTGAVKGVLRDTVHNYPVKSATIAVYRADSTLINYQLSNNYGEFVFRNLPLNNKFYIEVSHISYQLFRQGFEIPATPATVDLKTLIIKPRDILLKDVEIGIPPIVMNGDTLEFNPSAFKLDSNAVVEDLLRKIPNVTLWGDGQITVNGREVKSLLVNGKEFFGGDFKIATQNIPKNALEKVQVYNVQKDKKKPQDSVLTVNLKLKKGKDTGRFGKIGGGYGSHDRFESDASVNFFTPKMQLGIIGAGNNINKIANSVQTLVANSTFKGVGTSIGYQPDFRVAGISRTNLGGATFTYNFIEKPEYNNKKTLTANYFLQNRNNDNSGNSQTTTTIGENNKVIDRNITTNTTLSTSQSFDSEYDMGTQKGRLSVGQNFHLNTGETNSEALRSATNLQNVLTSTNNTLSKNEFTNKSFSFNADYRYNDYINYKKKINNFGVRYNLNAGENTSERTNLTAFRSFVDATTNRDFNRKSRTNSNTISQQLVAELPNLRKHFFGNRNLANIDFGIVNTLNMSHTGNRNQVADFNSATGNYTGNAYLSNHIETNEIQETPGIAITKSYYKGLSNRYDRNLSLSVNVKQRLTYQDNKSDRSFQNLSRSYSNFVPSASINYYGHEYGDHSNQVNLNFDTDLQVPTIDQLAPLIDSTNLYNIRKGNLNLREAETRRLSLSFYHTQEGTVNTLNYSGSVNFDFGNNAIVDSTFIDEQNRRMLFFTNADGYRSVTMRASARKALKFKTDALQINLSGTSSFTRNPGYINSVFSFSNNGNNSADLGLNYTHRDKLALEARQNISFYSSRQNAFNTNYSGKNATTTMSGSYNATKKFTLSSNINFNTNRSSGSPAINYNIWNASAIYRFLKGSNAELKFSALDLLHQNSNIINTGNANSFTIATRNVLQQYFMTTFSYYPRQFGKNTGKK